MPQLNSYSRTSQKQIPRLFRWIEKKKLLSPGTVNLDMGGGRYDLGTEFFGRSGVKNIVLDEPSRGAASAAAAIAALKQRPADSITISNVLNVLETPEMRQRVMAEAAKYAKPGAPAFISVYRDSTVTPGRNPTSGTWQENRPIASYLDEVAGVFTNPTVVSGFIKAERPPDAMLEAALRRYLGGE